MRSSWTGQNWRTGQGNLIEREEQFCCDLCYTYFRLTNLLYDMETFILPFSVGECLLMSHIHQTGFAGTNQINVDIPWSQGGLLGLYWGFILVGVWVVVVWVLWFWVVGLFLVVVGLGVGIFLWVFSVVFFVFEVGGCWLFVGLPRFLQPFSLASRVLREYVFGVYLVFGLFGFLALRQDVFLCFVFLST